MLPASMLSASLERSCRPFSLARHHRGGRLPWQLPPPLSYACSPARTGVFLASPAGAAVGLTRARLSSVFQFAKGFRGKAKNAFRVANQQVMGALQNQVCSPTPCLYHHRALAHVKMLVLESWMPSNFPSGAQSQRPATTPCSAFRRIFSCIAIVTCGVGAVQRPKGAEARDAVAVGPAHQRGRARARPQVRRLHPRHDARQHGGAAPFSPALARASQRKTVVDRAGPRCERVARWTKACSQGTL